MVKGILKYYFFPLIYIGGVLCIEFIPNILSVAVWGSSILLCVVAIFKVIFKKITIGRKAILIAILNIPIFDITFNLSYLIRNKIKGEIVFSAIDDSFATTKSITIRQKNGLLRAEYDFSVAGLGKTEQADISIEHDSVLILNLKERDYTERLTFHKYDNQIRSNEKNLIYRVVENKLFK
jgi:hypothetical protein